MMGSLSWDDHGVTTLVQARHISATLPVVLCAPHGGNAVDGDQAETLLERPSASPPTNASGGDGESGTATRGGAVSLIADVGTSQLVEEIDRRLTRKFRRGEGFASAAEAPAVVVARFHRKYIDANRPLDESGAVAVHPSCRRAKEVHECYHGAIETAVRALRTRLGKAGTSGGNQVQERVEGERQGSRLLLLDVHGQGKFVDKLLIGTCNGKTADLEALNATEKGFLWHLRRNLNSIDEVPGVRSTGKAGNSSSGTRPQVDRSGEVRQGAGEGEHKQAWVREGTSLGDQDDGEAERTHEAAKIDSAVVLPLLGDTEVPKYTGGYTVKRHGVSSGGEVALSVTSPAATGGCRNGEGGVAVDAVQLEFGSRLRRTSEARAVVAEAVATAVFAYLQNQAETL